MTIVDTLATAGEAGVNHRGARTVGVVVSAQLDEVVDAGERAGLDLCVSVAHVREGARSR